MCASAEIRCAFHLRGASSGVAGASSAEWEGEELRRCASYETLRQGPFYSGCNRRYPLTYSSGNSRIVLLERFTDSAKTS